MELRLFPGRPISHKDKHDGVRLDQQIAPSTVKRTRAPMSSIPSIG
jgi:hypothetical protein